MTDPVERLADDLRDAWPYIDISNREEYEELALDILSLLRSWPADEQAAALDTAKPLRLPPRSRPPAPPQWPPPVVAKPDEPPPDLDEAGRERWRELMDLP